MFVAIFEQLQDSSLIPKSIPFPDSAYLDRSLQIQRLKLRSPPSERSVQLGKVRQTASHNIDSQVYIMGKVQKAGRAAIRQISAFLETTPWLGPICIQYP
jgi:hypothetical protein